MSSEKSIVRRAAGFLSKRLRPRPKIALVLGSGLGDLDFGRETARIPFGKIPGFPRPLAGGHSGVLTAVGPLVVLRGRSHYYEGRSMDEVVRPVRVLAALGVETLVLTNAAGAVNPALQPGDFLLIRDHLNLMGVHPLRGGPRFVDLTDAYDSVLRRLALRAARGLRLRFREGVYAAMAGPAYETPAEIRMLRTLGADAVGMSTVPETIAAREAGVRVLAISLITNAGAGMSRRRVSHKEVLETAGRVRDRAGALLRAILAGLGSAGPS